MGLPRSPLFGEGSSACAWGRPFYSRLIFWEDMHITGERRALGTPAAGTGCYEASRSAPPAQRQASPQSQSIVTVLYKYTPIHTNIHQPWSRRARWGGGTDQLRDVLQRLVLCLLHSKNAAESATRQRTGIEATP